MEMPSGWKYLKYPDLVLPPQAVHDYITRAKKAADLMKEMAEALEESHNLLNQYKDICEQNSEIIVNNYNVLKKFNGWK